MTFKINIDRLSWNRAMKHAFERGVEGGLKRAGLAVEKFARDEAPVDTGSLRSSITSQPIGRGLDMIVEVGPNVKSPEGAPYDIYQELGTGIHAETFDGKPAPGRHMIRPRRAKWLRFKTKMGDIVYAKEVAGVEPTHYMKIGLERTDISREFVRGFNAVRR